MNLDKIETPTIWHEEAAEGLEQLICNHCPTAYMRQGELQGIVDAMAGRLCDSYDGIMDDVEELLDSKYERDPKGEQS